MFKVQGSRLKVQKSGGIIMPARSGIALLPEDIKAELDKKLITQAFSGYRGLEEWLCSLGYEIKKSSLHRYGQEFEQKCEAIKIATEQAKAIVAVVGDDEGNMNEALIRLIQQLSFDILIDSDKDNIAEILPRMGVMVAKLSKASVDQKKYAAEARKKALEDAADVVEETAKQQGLDIEQARFWREQVLGIK